MKFSQQKAPFPSSNQCWSSLSCSPVSVTNFIFFSFFFLETKTVLRLQRQNQLGRIFLPYSPHPDRMILSHNSQSKQCSENPALHANVQTVLPQEWSLFGHGGEQKLAALFWTDASSAARNSDSGKAEGVSILFFDTLLWLYCPEGDIFRCRKPTANRKLAAGRFVLYPEIQVVQTSLIPFIWKQNYLRTIQLGLRLCLPSLFSFRETVNDSLPLQKPGFMGRQIWPSACCIALALWNETAKNTWQLVSTDFILCPEVTP